MPSFFTPVLPSTPGLALGSPSMPWTIYAAQTAVVPPITIPGTGSSTSVGTIANDYAQGRNNPYINSTTSFECLCPFLVTKDFWVVSPDDTSALLHISCNNNGIPGITSANGIDINAAVNLYGASLSVIGQNGVQVFSPDTTRYLQTSLANGANPTLFSSTGVINSNAPITVTSDYRVKRNVETLDGALALVDRLRPVRFDPVDVPGVFHGDGARHLGFIAHELGEVLPGAVTGEKDRQVDGRIELQGLHPVDLIALLTRAVQELAGRIARLEAVHAW